MIQFTTRPPQQQQQQQQKTVQQKKTRTSSVLSLMELTSKQVGVGAVLVNGPTVVRWPDGLHPPRDCVLFLARVKMTVLYGKTAPSSWGMCVEGTDGPIM